MRRTYKSGVIQKVQSSSLIPRIFKYYSERKTVCKSFNSMCSEYKRYEWDLPNLFPFFNRSSYSAKKFVMIILNTLIKSPEIIIPLWKQATLRLAVDGGANRLYDMLRNCQMEEFSDLIPDVLCGDFDSVRTNVKNFYEERHVEIIHTPDQSKTDFLKALEIVSQKNKSTTVIVSCDNVGRLDHIMANLNGLYQAACNNCTNDLNIYLLSSMDITWLLKTGYHAIKIPPDLWSEKSHCSLIPLGQQSRVSTHGLKWNINDGILQFGGIVSSSNTYNVSSINSTVCINTDSALIWSMGIRDDV